MFANKVASCLVNPRACHETEPVLRPTAKQKRVAVVGASPAGLTAATLAAERGHEVHLFDAASAIGGQLNMAEQVPGKEAFFEMLGCAAAPGREHRRIAAPEPARGGGRPARVRRDRAWAPVPSRETRRFRARSIPRC